MKRLELREYPNGLTVCELKKLLKDVPEVDSHTGGAYEVWMMTGRGLSSPVKRVIPLNRSDILFES